MSKNYRYIAKDIDGGSRIDEVIPKITNFPIDALKLIQDRQYKVLINSKPPDTLVYNLFDIIYSKILLILVILLI